MQSKYPLINFDPIAISIGPLDVHWYGITYLLAFLSFWLIANAKVSRQPKLVGLEQRSDQRRNILWHAWHNSGWSHRLYVVLQFRYLDSQPIVSIQNMGWGHVIPWRTARLDGRAVVVCQAQP